ncbi:MAG: hypothetical protein LIQ30_10560 [Planctomycetes bacterium]|nr:hypothetical protein [Planctomycetota bacterium]
MNSAMSTKRVFLEKPGNLKLQTYGWLAALVIGIVFFVAGIHTGMTALLIPGFVGLAGGILYFNVLLWAKIFAKKPYTLETRISRLPRV